MTARIAKFFDPVCGEAHSLSRDRKDLLLFEQHVGVSQAGRDARVIFEDLGFAPAARQKSDDEFDGQAGASDHRFADEDVRID